MFHINYSRITTIGAAGEWNGATDRCRVRIGRQKVNNLYVSAMTFFFELSLYQILFNLNESHSL